MFGYSRKVNDLVKWSEYVRAIAGEDTGKTIALRSGIAESTISRWLSGQVPARVPRAVVQLARAYNSSPLQALVAAGYLDASELDLAVETPRRLQLRDFTELELAEEMVRRIADGGSPVLEAPLDEDHPAMKRLVDSTSPQQGEPDLKGS